MSLPPVLRALLFYKERQNKFYSPVDAFPALRMPLARSKGHPACGPPFLPLVHKPDGAGGAILAVNFGISASKALVAQVRPVFHAHEAGFLLRVTGA
jgi:hypothetical protein